MRSRPANAARTLVLCVCASVASVRLAAQCPDGTPAPCAARPARAAAAPAPNSVAVLYLENLSRDTADAAIADGLTEEIIARLSQVAGVRVASRFAVLRYRSRSAPDPHRVGRELGVRYVLGGTLRRNGERLRVVIAVTDAAAGFNVWGQTYERPMRDIFSVEDSVALEVAEAVRGRLTGGERARLAPVAASTNVEAYQAYLRGRVAIRSRTAVAASAAIADYRRAIALDPRFARAYAGLAQALALARDWGWRITGLSADSVRLLATLAAEQALAMDSSSAQSWLAAAMVERAVDAQRALQLHRLALVHDSGDIEALHQLAWGYLLGAADLDSAMAAERRAIAHDPYYAYAYAGLAMMLNAADRPRDAVAAVAQGAAVDSTNAPLYWALAEADLGLGRPDEARAAADRTEALGFDPLGVRILRALVRLRAGDTASAVAALPALEQSASADSARSAGGLAYSAAEMLSGLYAQLGRANDAVRWAERVAHLPRRFYAVKFARDWYWEPVRDTPVFQAMLASLRQ